ncbi:MAG: sulfotransferase family protein [Actinomycetes bacterium]
MDGDLETAAPRRRLVLVAGVGRSGTSVFAGILRQAGFHVPQPEVDADSTNPKGFGEPRWVVDFHRRQLEARRVSVWDSRPAAWEDTAHAADDAATFHELRSWLAVQFVGRDHVVVKDPRIGWFLPLWDRAARDLGIETSFATLLRHPAEAVSSAMKWYGDWQNPASRTTSWLNVMLETEYATRGSRRVFVRYEDLLADWSSEIRRVGDALEIPLLHQIDDDTRAAIDAFVDPTLHRSKVSWADLGVPRQVEEMTEDVWKQFVSLARPGGDNAENAAALDVSREAYRHLYAEAEQIAQSSLHALRPRKSAASEPKSQAVSARPASEAHRTGGDALVGLAEGLVPRKLLRRVPPVWRARILRLANRVGNLVRRARGLVRR